MVHVFGRSATAEQILFRFAVGSVVVVVVVVVARDVTRRSPKFEIVGIDINDKFTLFPGDTPPTRRIGARNARRICARAATYLSSRPQIKRAIPTR